MVVGLDNITPGTSTSSSLSLGGMRPYLQDLLTGLPEKFPNWKFKLFTPAWNEPFEILNRNVEVVRCPGAPRNRLGRVVFEQFRLPQIISQEKVDLWLGTCNYLPLALRCRSMLLIQSHQFFTNPEAFGVFRGAWLRTIVRLSARKADRIGVQCHAAGKTLRQFVKVPESKVDVILNRLADVGRSGPDTASVTRPYILYISGIYPFKNHNRLIRAFASVRPQFPGLALVLVGGGPDRDLRSLASRLGLQGDVIFLGRAEQAAIPGLYRHAVASVFPSLEETFGLPVLEAMSLDCPVVTSNRSSMEEIAGDAAILVDPESITSIAEGLKRVVRDGDLRREMIGRGRRQCALFTRQNTIDSLAAALSGIH